jgi:hypothetical protein
MPATPAQPNLTFDELNANKGSVRGDAMLERSLQQYGAGRSGLADKNGVIIAGNKTIAKAQELGIPIREIESDGRTLFVIKRVDLDIDTPEGRELAIADNRVGETSLTWDTEVLTALADDGVDLSQFWFEDELIDVLNVVPDFDPVGIDEQGRLDEKAQVECPECGHRFAP